MANTSQKWLICEGSNSFWTHLGNFIKWIEGVKEETDFELILEFYYSNLGSYLRL